MGNAWVAGIVVQTLVVVFYAGRIVQRLENLEKQVAEMRGEK